MSERSLSVSPVIEPFAGGVIGLGIGYSLAPRKYSLKSLLILKKDSFENIYSKDLRNNLSVREQIALKGLTDAREAYRGSKRSVQNQIKEAAVKWMDKFRKVEVSEDLKTFNQTSRENLKKAISETNYVSLNRAYRSAKSALKEAPDNEQLKTALKEANTNLSRAKAIIGSKIELYKNSVRQISNDRLAKVKNEPLKYYDVREAYKNFLDKLALRRTAASNKLFELVNNKNLLRDYETLKEYLPKARSKSAIIGAVITGTITSLLMMSLTSSIRETA